MAGEIIRAGDKTSHGGTVIEGSQSDICMGRPIAFMGHMTFCPQCKGGFPIVEGAADTTFYGRGVALAGMKTACGAVLLAGQFTDRVHQRSASSESAVSGQSARKSETKDDDDIEIEHFYRLAGDDGISADDYRYDLRLPDKLHTKAGAYTKGETVTVSGDTSTRLVTWLSRDGGMRE